MLLPIMTARMNAGNFIFLYKSLILTMSGKTGRKQNIAKINVAIFPLLVCVYLSRRDDNLFILFWFLK